MVRPGLVQNAFIILLVCVAMATASPAQTFTILFSFDGTNGAYPWNGLIQASDGNFYGTTIGTNGYGTVFKMTTGGTLTTLHSFDSTDGAQPSGLIQATDGNFYGTTAEGGASANCGTLGCGTVFKITPGGRLITLHNFDANDGAASYAGLIQATDGNFYGTTSEGGANGRGTVFKMTAWGRLTTLHSFDKTDGAVPNGLIQGAGGNFYGTTQEGGSSTKCGIQGCGTFFSMTAGGALTTLYSFDSSDGSYPASSLIQATDGNFYGTTFRGGGSTNCFKGCGTVFEITPGGTLTTLHTFDYKDGNNPNASLMQARDGNFYGTTETGGSPRCRGGCGTVFEIAPGGVLTTLHRFGITDGVFPVGTLIQAFDGNFYGTSGGGGASGYGTVFRFIVAPAVTLSRTSLSFGNQALGETSTTKTVTLTNSGTAPLIVDGIAVDGDFAISANTCGAALDIDNTCGVRVTFTPTMLGKLVGTLTFTDNASNSPQVVPLSGAGIEPAILMPVTATYAPQTVGTTSTAKTFTLTNYQSVALTSIVISASGDFAVSATTCTTSLAAKSRCSINIIFAPKATGARTGTLRVSDSASNTPQASSLNGTGK